MWTLIIDFFTSIINFFCILRKSHFKFPAFKLNKYKKNGIKEIYLKSDNLIRSEKKTQLLKSSQNIMLIARSGRSYLNPDFLRNGRRTNSSAIFWEEIKQVFNNPNGRVCLKVILGNPYSIESVHLLLDNYPELETSDQIVSMFKQQNIFKFFEYSIEGYMILNDICGYRKNKSVEIRILDYPQPATLLLGDFEVFFEPYLHSRIEQGVFGLSFIEILFKNSSNVCCSTHANQKNCKDCSLKQKNICNNSLYKVLYDHCSRTWIEAMSLEDYRNKERDELENMLINSYRKLKNEYTVLSGETAKSSV